MLKKRFFGSEALLRTMTLVTGLILVGILALSFTGCGGGDSNSTPGGGGGDSNWSPLTSWSQVPSGTWDGSGSISEPIDDGVNMRMDITSWPVTFGASGITNSGDMRVTITFTGANASESWPMLKMMMGSMFSNPSYNDSAHSISGTMSWDAIGDDGGDIIDANDLSAWEINQARNRLRVREGSDYFYFTKR